MRKAFLDVYLYIVTIPDRLYPFKCEIEGQWVRGKRSYEQAVNEALETYGLHRLGFKLMFYRQTFHFLGSVLFIVAATLVSQELIGSERALYVLLFAAIIALAFQEFYVHPRLYGQKVKKGVIDLAAWVVPIALYFFFFI